MSPLLVAVLVVVGVLALLVARGMYVIGQGSEAEQAARAATDGEMATVGWRLLDWLRTADLPLVSRIEAWLGRGGGES